MIAHDLARREDLIRDFIIAASKTYGDSRSINQRAERCRSLSISTPSSQPHARPQYAAVGRMRGQSVMASTIIDTYFDAQSDDSPMCASL